MKLGNYSFRVVWSDEDHTYIATCPEFPGVSGFGETADSALREAGSALELTIDSYREENWTLPDPRRLRGYSGQFRLRVPKSLHAQLAEQAEFEGVSLNSLAVSLLARGVGQNQCVAERLGSNDGTQPSRDSAA